MFPLRVITVGGLLDAMSVRAILNGLNVMVEADIPSVGTMVNNLAGWGDKPRLLLVQVNTEDDLQKVKWLKSAFSNWPMMAIVEVSKNARMVMSAMRAGAWQVVQSPCRGEDFQEALNCIADQFGSNQTGSTQVIAVSGVSGGCGATTVAINLASELAASRQVSTVLVECTLKVGVFTSYLDLSPRYTTYDLLTDMTRVDSDSVKTAVTQVSDHFSILPGPDRLVGSNWAQTGDMLLLIDMLRRVAPLVILDLPCTFDDHFFQAVLVCDQVILVNEQTVPSVRALQQCRDALERGIDIKAQSIPKHLLCSRYKPKLVGFDANRLKDVLQTPELHTFLEDQSVRDAVNSGRTIRQQNPKSPALADINKLGQVVMPGAEANAKPESTFQRFFRAFSR